VDPAQVPEGPQVDVLGQVLRVGGVVAEPQSDPENIFLIGHHFVKEPRLFLRQHYSSFIHEERRSRNDNIPF
jgi:hypothetical protein